MSWWDRALRSLGMRNETPPPSIPDSSSWQGFFNPRIKGVPTVSETSLLSISAAYACVNLISGAISALPYHLYRREKDGEREQAHDDDLWWILNEEFMPRWSAANGWEFWCQSLLLHGNAYAAIRRQGHRIVGIEPCHPLNAAVALAPGRRRLVYTFTWEDGQRETLDQDDVVHVAGFGFNGFKGISPIQHVLGDCGGIALATQDYAARFFANSARPDIILATDQVLDREAAGRIAEDWARKYQGHASAHQPAVIGHGVKIHQLTMTAEDAQLLATRQFQIEEIARAYGVPPFMIGHTEKTTSWGSGIETMGTGFVRFTLRQHLNKFQTELNRKMFRTARRFGEFDTFELERADMKTLFDGFRTAIGRGGEDGFMTTDEVRMKLNLKRTPGGDQLGRGAEQNAQEPIEPAAA